MLNLLRAFGKWFASPLGIYETVVVLMAWIALEKFRIVHDASGYQILYWLTVYSAVTQPILAFIAYEAGNKTDRALEHIERIVEHLDIKDKGDPVG